MVVIRLYGVLEQVAQRTVRLSTATFDEAMRGLVANFPRLSNVFRDMRVSVLIDGKMMTFEDCLRPMHAERIDIMPVIGGSGPAIFIVAGAALTAGSAVIADLFVGTILSSITAASIAQFGLAMIIGGISQMLFKPPKPNLGGAAADSASFNFNGPVNVSQQGNVVPIGYGRMRIGSVTVSANVQTWDIPIGPAPAPAPAPSPPPDNPDGPFQTDFGPDGGL